MTKRTTFVKTLEVVSGTKSLAKAGEKTRVVRFVDVPDKRKKQSCELCGTRFQRGAWVTFETTNSTILIGGNCLVSLLEGHFSANRRQGVLKRQVSSLLRKIYDAEADPKSWLSWLEENAPEELAHDVALISFVGKAASWESLATLIRYHDANRMFLTAALFSPFNFIPKVLELPSKMTIAGHDAICHRYSREMKSPLARKILREYANGNELIAESTLSASKKRIAAAIYIATEARNLDEDLAIEYETDVNWRKADGSTGDQLIWNPKLGIGIPVEGLSQLCRLAAPQAFKGTRAFLLDYWYSLAPKSKEAEDELYRKAAGSLFAMLAFRASERERTIIEAH